MWNNRGIADIEKELNISTDFTVLIPEGLKKYKAAKFLIAIKNYIAAYKYIYEKQTVLEHFYLEQPLYLSSNLFTAYRNCAVLHISQITLFLNKEKLHQYLPFSVVSECYAYDESKFREELTNYSSLSPESYFAQFYDEAMVSIEGLMKHESDLDDYVFSINQNLATGLYYGFAKRELKYRISGIF